MLTSSARHFRSIAAAVCCLLGAYLVARWFYYFNGADRMLFGMVGVALIGFSVLLSRWGNDHAFTLGRNAKLAVGGLLLLLGIVGTSFLVWFVLKGGI